MIREHGDANVLKLESDFTTPKLTPGGVLVRNEYAGINFIDTYFRKVDTFLLHGSFNRWI